MSNRLVDIQEVFPVPQKLRLIVSKKAAPKVLSLVAVMLFTMSSYSLSIPGEDCNSRSLVESRSDETSDGAGGCRSEIDNYLPIEAPQLLAESPQEGTQNPDDGDLHRLKLQFRLTLVNDQILLHSNNTNPTPWFCTGLSCRAPPQ